MKKKEKRIKKKNWNQQRQLKENAKYLQYSKKKYIILKHKNQIILYKLIPFFSKSELFEWDQKKFWFHISYVRHYGQQLRQSNQQNI